MKEEQHRFLSLLGQLPARLTAEQAGWVLNCQAHDIPALVTARLLKPLGNPALGWSKSATRLASIGKNRTPKNVVLWMLHRTGIPFVLAFRWQRGLTAIKLQLRK